MNTIGAVVSGARGTSDELAAIVGGLAPLATQSSRNRVILDHEDLQIRIGMHGQFARMIERLGAIEPLRLTATRVVSAVFSTDASDVLVVKYWACSGEQRIPFYPAEELGDTTMRRFRDDLLKLAYAGLMHEYATRRTWYWRVSSKTQMVVLDTWFVLKPIENRADVIATISGIV